MPSGGHSSFVLQLETIHLVGQPVSQVPVQKSRQNTTIDDARHCGLPCQAR